MSSRRAGPAAAALLALGCQAGGAGGQVTHGDLARLVHFPSLLEHGFGATDLGDQRSRLFQVPVRITLRSLERYRWGLRLRLTGTFSTTDFEGLAGILEDPQIRGVALTPGVELLVPLSPTTTLRPWADLGGVRADRGDVSLIVGNVGLSAEILFPRGAWQLGVEPRAQYNWSWSLADSAATDDFGSVALKADVRRALGFRVGEARPDAGLYTEFGYFYDALEFTTVRGTSVKVDDAFEIGASLGFFYPRPKVWIVRVPRLSVGYRVGDALRGWRLRIGGDWATPLPPGSG